MTFRLHAFSLIFPVAIGVPLAWLLCMEIQQFRVRVAMEEKLETASLQTISIPVNEVEWFENNTEILVNNHLFDVKEFHIENGRALFTGIFDEQETHIRQLMAQASGAADHAKLLGRFFSVDLFQVNTSVLPVSVMPLIIDRRFRSLVHKLSSSFSRPFSPPPE